MWTPTLLAPFRDVSGRKDEQIRLPSCPESETLAAFIGGRTGISHEMVLACPKTPPEPEDLYSSRKPGEAALFSRRP